MTTVKDVVAAAEAAAATAQAAALAAQEATASGSLVDLKGDLLVGSAPDTLVRVPVGANGQVFTADSAEAAGVRWATPSAGGGASVVPAQVPAVSHFLGPWAADGNGTSADALASGAWTPCMFVIPAQITIDQLGFYVDTAQAVNARVLLYSSDATGRPSTLVTSATGSCAATGAVMVALGSAQVLAAGIYWGFVRSDAGTTARFRCVRQQILSGISDNTANLSAPPATFLANPGTYAAPEATISAYTYQNTLNGNTRPLVMMRRSA